MAAKPFSLPASHRLKRKKLFEEIFSAGKPIRQSEISLLFIHAVLPATVQVQAAFAVPKRRFKKAVDRNRLKRLMREAYRRHKQPLENMLKTANKQVAVIFVFNFKEVLPYERVEQKITVLLQELEKQLLNANQP